MIKRFIPRIFLLLLSLILPKINAFAQETVIVRDTIWIMDGVEYNYNPLNKVKPVVSKDQPDSSFTAFNYTNNTDFRRLVDSIQFLDFDKAWKDSLVKVILKEDYLFNHDWCNDCIFEQSEESTIQDTVRLTLVQGSEKYLYPNVGTYFWGFGPRWGKIHKGLDIGLTTGDTIYVAFNGIVRYAKFNNGGYGNCVVVRHFNGIETLYAHMSKIIVEPGTLVYAGEPLGLGGSTGKSTGPHLHFETRYIGKAFDPLKVFDRHEFILHSEVLALTNKDIQEPKVPTTYHVVKAGETLSHIAAKHRTTVSKIQKLNKNIRNPNMVSVGQRIRVK